MTIKERSDFLVERYGENCIEIVNSLLEDNQDTKYLSYWKDVLETCQEIITNKKQVNA
jgi:hypothetical protein